MQAKRYNPPLLGPAVTSCIPVENADGLLWRAKVDADGNIHGMRHYPIVVHVDTRQQSMKHFKRVCHALSIAVEKLESEELIAVKDDDGTIVPVKLKCGTFMCYGMPKALVELTRHPSVRKWSFVPNAAKVGRGQGQSPKK